MLKLLGKYLKAYTVPIIVTVVFIVLQIVAELMLPSIMADIVDTGVVDSDVPYILGRGWVMLAWALLSAACVVVSAFFSARTAMGFGRDIRHDIFKKVEDFSAYDFDRFGTSTLITRNTNDVQQLERLVQMGLTILLMTPLMFIGALVMAFMTDVKLASVALCGIPVIAAALLVVVRFGMPLVRSLQKKIDRLNLVTREGLTGIRVIRAYNKEDYERGRFAEANEDLCETNVRIFRILSLLLPLAILILNAVVIALSWFGAINVQAGNLMVGDLMAVIQYAMLILTSVMMLSMLFVILPRAIAAADRIVAVLDTEPSIADAAGATVPADLDCTQAGSIAFEQVTFTFPDAQTPSLVDLDFVLPAGKTTAVIGSTGSGKSTIINLIERFNDPTSGRITLDGFDIATFPQQDLRRLIAYVPQKATLFTGTIAENIRSGYAEATDDDVRRAARIAQADAFICAKEDGYDTAVAQKGGNLSGGQCQRIAIARALVRDAKLYVFDDSFSALDFKTDSLIRSALREEMEGCTILIVAQRVSVAMDADNIIVLDEGRIVGEGTHVELLESCEVYRDIATSQLSDEELAIGVAASFAASASAVPRRSPASHAGVDVSLQGGE